MYARQPGLSVHVQDEDAVRIASPRKNDRTPSPGKRNPRWTKVRVGTALGATPRKDATTPRRGDVAQSPGGRLHQSWESVLNPGSARGKGVGNMLSGGQSIKAMLEESDREEELKRRREEEENQRVAVIMQEAMRKANVAAARGVEVRMAELSAKQRELEELEGKLRTREARLPAEVLDDNENTHMTAISFAELNALRMKLQDYDKQEELRQRVIAQKRLDEKAVAEQAQEKKRMRASEKIMANWRSSSSRKCILAWAEKCVAARQGKAKIHRVLMRLTLRVRSTAFARWVTHAKTASVYAERKALEQAAERKFRTRLYASFSGVQTGLRGEEMDEESLIERIKEKDNKCVELQEQIEELRASEEALQATVHALKEEMETHRQVWALEKADLTAAIKAESAAVAEQWQARVQAVEDQKRASVEKNRKECNELEYNLREVTEKAAEWQAMYTELQSIMDQSVSQTPKVRLSATEGVHMV